MESQQSEDLGAGNPRLSAAELDRNRRREGLEMSRRRIARELEASRSDVHRTALQAALAHLDEELRKI